MSQYSWVRRVFCGAASLFCVILAAAATEAQVPSAQQAKPDVRSNGAIKKAAKYQAHITIYDLDGTSVLVEAKKRVDQGSNAFDVLRSIVNLEFITFVKLGSFVTSLAGLKAPDGYFWELNIDGQPSQVGIGDVKIDKDIEIVWKLKSTGGGK